MRSGVFFFSGVYHNLLRESQDVISDTLFEDELNKLVEVFDSAVPFDIRPDMKWHFTR